MHSKKSRKQLRVMNALENSTLHGEHVEFTRIGIGFLTLAQNYRVVYWLDQPR